MAGYNRTSIDFLWLLQEAEGVNAAMTVGTCCHREQNVHLIRSTIEAQAWDGVSNSYDVLNSALWISPGAAIRAALSFL